MTEEFKKQLEEAREEAVSKYEKQLEKKYEEQKRYAELYLKLVLAMVKVYDYDKGDFDFRSIPLDKFESIIGSPHLPSKASGCKGNKIKVCFSYEEDGWGNKGSEPNDSNIDYDIVNKALSENGVSVKKKYLTTEDGWGSSDYELQLSFDSSILEIEKTKKDIKEKTYHDLKNK